MEGFASRKSKKIEAENLAVVHADEEDYVVGASKKIVVSSTLAITVGLLSGRTHPIQYLCVTVLYIRLDSVTPTAITRPNPREQLVKINEDMFSYEREPLQQTERPQYILHSKVIMECMSHNNEEDSEFESEELTEKPQLGPNEVFCTECGSVIKERAEICPECGVKQQPEETESQREPQQPQQQGPQTTSDSGVELTERRQFELEKVASKNKTTVILLGIFLTPAAYWKVGNKWLAVLNFLTLNFLFTGWIIVPIHCNSKIKNAREELRMAGVGGY